MGNFAENLNLGNRFPAPPPRYVACSGSGPLYWKRNSRLELDTRSIIRLRVKTAKVIIDVDFLQISIWIADSFDAVSPEAQQMISLKHFSSR